MIQKEMENGQGSLAVLLLMSAYVYKSALWYKIPAGKQNVRDQMESDIFFACKISFGKDFIF